MNNLSDYDPRWCDGHFCPKDCDRCPYRAENRGGKRMAEYIGREEAKAKIREKFKFVPARIEINEALNSIPAADVWEVVHCADCAHAEESLVNGCVYCNEMERARIKEGFCAWGERKES